MTKIALLSKVYPYKSDWNSLFLDLEKAKEKDASLVILPELPLNPWSSYSKEIIPEDSEKWKGIRWKALSNAAKKTQIAVLGGIILEDSFGIRKNTALLFDKNGKCIGIYSKIHIPDEPGFRERAHYEPGENLNGPFNLNGINIGIQICSDLNRPSGSQILAAKGAHLIACPRATEIATVDRWRPVIQAIAITSCCWVTSVNRPGPEKNVLIGGPSWIADPEGKILIESTDELIIANINFDRINEYQNNQYPGYLDIRSDLYADGWSSLHPRCLPYGIRKEAT